MKVLHVLNSLGVGGIEVMLLRSLPHLKKAGVHIDFCCNEKGKELDHLFEKAGATIYRVEKKTLPSSSAREFTNFIKDKKYDIVHSHYGYSSGGIAKGAKMAGVSVVVSLHSAGSTSLWSWNHFLALRQLKNLWLGWHRRYLDHYADRIIGHSKVNIESYCSDWKLFPDLYGAILNGIDFPVDPMEKEQARDLLGLDKESLYLLHVGGFRPLKNHLGLLEIFRLAKMEKNDLKLIFVGGGKGRSKIERKAEELGLEKDILFAGEIGDVTPYYLAADLFVFPSEIEGCGNVLLESQSLGLPVVASDIAAHREAVAPEQREFLFQLPDYRSGADKVIEQLEGKNRSQIIEQSKGYVRREYSIERFCEEIVSVYNGMI